VHPTANLISRTQLRFALSKFHEKNNIEHQFILCFDTICNWETNQTNRIRDAIDLIHTIPARICLLQLHYIHIYNYSCGYIDEELRSHGRLIIIMDRSCYYRIYLHSNRKNDVFMMIGTPPPGNIKTTVLK